MPRRPLTPAAPAADAAPPADADAAPAAGAEPRRPPLSTPSRPRSSRSSSGRDRAALVAQARRLREHLASTPSPLADVGFSLATGRAHLAERAAVVAGDAEGLLAGLDALIAGASDDRLLEAAARSGRAVFVFPGQGSQWEGMAAALLDILAGLRGLDRRLRGGARRRSWTGRCATC